MKDKNLHIDHFLKNLAEQGEAEPDERAWEKMKLLLNEPKRKPPVRWPPALLFLLMLIFTVWLFTRPDGKIRLSENNSPSQKKDGFSRKALPADINDGVDTSSKLSSAKQHSQNVEMSRKALPADIKDGVDTSSKLSSAKQHSQNVEMSRKALPADIKDGAYISSIPVKRHPQKVNSNKNLNDKSNGDTLVKLVDPYNAGQSVTETRPASKEKEEQSILVRKIKNGQKESTASYSFGNKSKKGRKLNSRKKKTAEEKPGVAEYTSGNNTEAHNNTVIENAGQRISVTAPESSETDNNRYQHILFDSSTAAINKDSAVKQSNDTTQQQSSAGNKNKEPKKRIPFSLPSHAGISLSVNRQRSPNPNTGFSGGLYYNFAVSKKISIQPELQVISRKENTNHIITHTLFGYQGISDTSGNIIRYDIDSTATGYKVKRYVMLQPDISFQYKINRFSFMAGLGVGLRISVKGDTTRKEFHYSSTAKPALSEQPVAFSAKELPGKTAFVFRFGAEYAIKKNWSVGFNYQLNKISIKNKPAYINESGEPFNKSSFTLTLRYRFFKK